MLTAMATIPRRDFLIGSGLALGASVALQPGCASTRQPDIATGGDRDAARSPGGESAGLADPSTVPAASKWDAVRAEFLLDREWMHFAGFLLASHPRSVRDALARHRDGLDRNPANYLEEHRRTLENRAYSAAEAFIGASPGEVALTDSTTMGLGLLYGGLQFRDGQEILTSEHDHYSTHESLRLRTERGGVAMRKVALHDRSRDASVEDIVGRLMAAVTPRTRVVAVTWVHSSSGLKLPLRAIADALTQVNRGRDEDDRALLCVDGVHGFGVDVVDMAAFGCDFFVAGCHKWTFGPRGTGLVFGREELWKYVTPTIPAFHGLSARAWMNGRPPDDSIPGGYTGTPGGFHSFEHRWALTQAFQFHDSIGREDIAARIHALNRQLKEGLAGMAHVTLHTPMSDDLSAGIVCFEVAGIADPRDVVARLHRHKIIASRSPYRTSYARLAPSLLNSPDEVDAALRAVRELA